jgi:hypothetical protein
VSVALAVALALWSQPAEPAATAAVADDVCGGLFALHGISRDSRAALVGACRSSSPPPDWQRTLWRLNSSDDWQGAAAARILGPKQPSGDNLAGEFLNALTRANIESNDACRPLRQRLVHYFQELGTGSTPRPPITQASLGTEDAACLMPRRPPEGRGKPAEAAKPRWAESYFLTVSVPSKAEVTVLWTNHASSSMEYYDQSSFYMFQGHQLLFVPVPENSMVSVSLSAPSITQPWTWHEAMTRDRAIWGVAPELSCVSVTAALDKGLHLYLDGVELKANEDADGVQRIDLNLLVTGDNHEFVATRKTYAGDSILWRETVAKSSLSGRTSACYPVALDLRAGSNVGVSVTEIAAACHDDPITREGLVAAAKEGLKSYVAERNIVDLSELANYRVALRTLQESLVNDASGSSAATTTPRLANVADRFLTSSREIWQRNIGSLLLLDLDCRGAATGPRTYTIKMTRADSQTGLDEPRSELFGPDRVYSIEFTDPGDVDRALRQLLAQRHGAAYHAIVAPPSVRYGRHADNEEIRAFYHDPDAPVVAVVERLSSNYRRRAPGCDEFSGRIAENKARHQAKVVLEPDGHARIDLEGHPPGMYRIALGHANEGGVEPIDVTCVAIEPVDETVVELAPFVTARGTLPWANGGGMITAGRTWWGGLGGLGWLGVSFAGGYLFQGFRSFSSNPPGWQDLGARPGEPERAMTWERHALALLPAFTLRFHPRRESYKFQAAFGLTNVGWLRVGALLSLGWVNLRRVPQELTAFRSKPMLGDFDVDVGVQVAAGLTIRHKRALLAYSIAMGAYESRILGFWERGSAFDNQGFTIGFNLGVVIPRARR